MLCEVNKYDRVAAYEKMIKKEDPEKAWHTLSVDRLLTPGFIKYFRDSEWKLVDFKDFENLYVMKDPKFEKLSSDCSAKGVLRKLWEYYQDGRFDVWTLLNVLKKQGVVVKSDLDEETLTMLHNIRKFQVLYEINHETGFSTGPFHLFKEDGKYTIVNGNHRLLAYLAYCLGMGMDFCSVKAWVGEKIGKDTKVTK